MYRYRATQQVLYGRFNEFLKAWQELNIIFHRRGWPEASVWVPAVGTGNEVVLEMDFPDLGDFQKWYQAFQADVEGMNLYRATKDVVVQGSLHDAHRAGEEARCVRAPRKVGTRRLEPARTPS